MFGEFNGEQWPLRAINSPVRVLLDVFVDHGMDMGGTAGIISGE